MFIPHILSYAYITRQVSICASPQNLDFAAWCRSCSADHDSGLMGDDSEIVLREGTRLRLAPRHLHGLLCADLDEPVIRHFRRQSAATD